MHAEQKNKHFEEGLPMFRFYSCKLEDNPKMFNSWGKISFFIRNQKRSAIKKIWAYVFLLDLARPGGRGDHGDHGDPPGLPGPGPGLPGPGLADPAAVAVVSSKLSAPNCLLPF